MEKVTDELTIEKVDGRDLPFIYSSWLKSYKFSSSFARGISDKIFYERHHVVIERILNATTTSVFLATHKTEGCFIGYLVVQEVPDLSIIHFAYTKGAFRNKGVMTALIDAWGKNPNSASYTHRTFDAKFLTKRYPLMVYDPYLIG
jgi:hypothetical protein